MTQPPFWMHEPPPDPEESLPPDPEEFTPPAEESAAEKASREQAAGRVPASREQTARRAPASREQTARRAPASREQTARRAPASREQTARPPSAASTRSPSIAPPTPESLFEDALTILLDLTGRGDAAFHPGQFEAIEALVAGHRRALVVQRTGWGKSAVYFIAALLQRRAGAGPALIVSPLLALMRDQVAAAGRAGVRAAAINSANVTEWREVADRLDADDVDVLFVSPERLVNPRFRAEQLPRLVARCGLLVVDEAHCISDWGHDFRPDYRRIRDLIGALPAGVPVLATTATANARVVADVEEQLAVGGHEVFTLRGALARESLRLGVLDLGTPQRRLAWLAEHLGDLPGSGIVYCLTVSAAEDTAALLAKAGHRVLPYTGRTDGAERLAAEDALQRNEVKALVATSALGMGFDKPDLGFVVHLGAPSSPVSYYQQVGRAGRATPNADVLLLPGIEDRDIWHYFATNAMPTQKKADAIQAALTDAGRPLSVGALEARVDIRRSPLELLLKVLAVDGVVENVQGGWVATGEPWVYDAERYDRIAAARVTEQQAMLAFERLGTCRMAFLTSALDDPHAARCGRCDTCAGPWYPRQVSVPTLRDAQQTLDRVGVPIAPRALWPTGLDTLGIKGDGSPLKGKLALGEQVAEGRAVARLSDLGWRTRLRDLFAPDRDGRPVDAVVPPDLARAVLRVLAGWDWPQRPVAVAWVPSRGRPLLVESMATGIAGAGRLDLLGPLQVAAGAEPLRGSTNSAYRVREVWGRFAVGPDLAARLQELTGPVLLVDDLVDSRWTMTIAGRLLRRAGADTVLPLALASVG